MATKSKVDYKYEKLPGITSVELADPSGRLQKGVTLTTGIEMRRPAVGTTLSVKIKPLQEKKEPLPHTYDGQLTGIYVAPKRDGGIIHNWSVNKDKLAAAGYAAAKQEAEEAFDVVWNLLFS